MDVSKRQRTIPLLGVLAAPDISPPTRSSYLRGVLAFRLLVGAWMSVVFIWEIWERTSNDPAGLKDDVAHPGVGVLLLALAWLVMAFLVFHYNRDPIRLLQPIVVVPEIAVAAMLLFADAWVFGVSHSQALPTVWPLAVIFTAAVAAGTRAAVVTGVGLGLCRYLGWLAFPYTADDGPWSLARIASTVLFGVGGWVAGYLLTQQEAADRSISAFRAREEVARTLHDGVLQTLAVIQRRSDDGELVELARTQELELREYLFSGSEVADDVASALRSVARRAEQRYNIRVAVICAPDLPPGSAPVIHALAGAVGEALTNAAKHGGAERVTVYAEPGADCEFFVSVKDEGAGFDSTVAQVGEGIRRSIRGRVEELGGRVEVDGRPGRGTEVRLHV